MEKINIAELLKDCPKGMELDCTIFEDVYFDYADFDVVNKEIIRCYIQNDNFKTSILFTKYGCYSDNEKAKCVIFPKGKTTWEGFQRPFKDGDVVATSNGDQIFIFKEDAVNRDGSFSGVCYFGCDLQDNHLFQKGRWKFSRYATKEEKQKLFDAIKANGYKWNAETKTLEKLEKEKFDITTLKAFDKVLVRLYKDNEWCGSFFSHIDKEGHFHCYKYVTTSGKSYPYCIPYESNQHLLGTANDCDEYFKTWK